ncbi:unnamed protein product [Hymenolepis diminuta]|uniref:Uncharacterized protein n=1 Tax=Hymenolepis diminuta TaxID=6216 RepID=A0A0R3SJN8_HYMDI|nr:unnamed protein product [Hymenolepis diminuta]
MLRDLATSTLKNEVLLRSTKNHRHEHVLAATPSSFAQLECPAIIRGQYEKKHLNGERERSNAFHNKQSPKGLFCSKSEIVE